MVPKILFVCVHNSARSQMAEAFMKMYAEGEFEVYSGGIEPGVLNPYVVKILKEDEGIDISKNRPKSAFDFVKNGVLFQHVVTVCDESTSQRCPIFPGVKERIMMSFEDPSSFEGSEDDILIKVKEVKEKIKEEILLFIKLLRENSLKEDFPKQWKLG